MEQEVISLAEFVAGGAVYAEGTNRFSASNMFTGNNYINAPNSHNASSFFMPTRVDYFEYYN